MQLQLRHRSRVQRKQRRGPRGEEAAAVGAAAASDSCLRSTPQRRRRASSPLQQLRAIAASIAACAADRKPRGWEASRRQELDSPQRLPMRLLLLRDVGARRAGRRAAVAVVAAAGRIVACAVRTPCVPLRPLDDRPARRRLQAAVAATRRTRTLLPPSSPRRTPCSCARAAHASPVAELASCDRDPRTHHRRRRRDCCADATTSESGERVSPLSERWRSTEGNNGRRGRRREGGGMLPRASEGGAA